MGSKTWKHGKPIAHAFIHIYTSKRLEDSLTELAPDINCLPGVSGWMNPLTVIQGLTSCGQIETHSDRHHCASLSKTKKRLAAFWQAALCNEQFHRVTWLQGYKSKPWYPRYIKIAGEWMDIPQNMAIVAPLNHHNHPPISKKLLQTPDRIWCAMTSLLWRAVLWKLSLWSSCTTRRDLEWPW